MKKLLYILSVVFVFSACNNASGPQMSTAGYDTISVPGGSAQLLSKHFDEKPTEEGIVINGSKSGMWMIYNKDGKLKLSTQYVNGKKNGLELVFNNRNQVDEIRHYLDDQLHGVYETYNFGRIEESKEYKNGKLHGKFITYMKNGKAQQIAEFKNGLQDGKLQLFNDDGKMTLEYIYKNGEKVSETPLN